jgi:HAD superfamily hydrolase (TIGR01509 family)
MPEPVTPPIQAPIRAVVFDFFGVICSEIAPIVLPRYMSDEAAVAYKADVVERADRGDITYFDTLVDLSRRIGVAPEVLDAEFRACAKIDPAMASLIESVRRRCKTALLSNAMRPFLGEVMEKHDLNRLFDAKVISYEERLTKPDPAIFRLMAARLGVPAEECFFTDDNAVNVEAARAVGMQAAQFTGVEALRRELAARGVL